MKRSREQGRPETQPTLVYRGGFHSLFRAGLILLRLALAFGCGWLLAFLFTRFVAPSPDDTDVSVLFFVLVPPLVGIAAVATVYRQHKHLTLLSLGTGWLVIIGMYTYRYPLASQEDAAYQAMCATLDCHVGPVAVALLNLFLAYGIVVVLLGAGITGLLISTESRAGASYAPLIMLIVRTCNSLSALCGSSPLSCMPPLEERQVLLKQYLHQSLAVPLTPHVRCSGFAPPPALL